jgi:5-bromo-4-chloroindolyl phosphate hydrolysis protein
MTQEEINMTLDEAIINLHDIARLIEKEIGKGNLSDDIRQCANRLNFVIKEKPTNEAL